jgi:hypothetical protein
MQHRLNHHGLWSALESEEELVKGGFRRVIKNTPFRAA